MTAQNLDSRSSIANGSSTQNNNSDSQQLSNEIPNPNPSLYVSSQQQQQQPDTSKCSDKIPLAAKNLVLRGSRLKNVKWILGAVTYTGVDTKVMKNNDSGKQKVSQVECVMNRYVIFILLIQLVLCIFASFGNLKNCGQTNNINYYVKDSSCTAEFFLTWARYFLLLNTMLPISLIVSLEFVKVG